MKCSEKGCSAGVNGPDVQSTACDLQKFPGVKGLNMKQFRMFIRRWIDLRGAAADMKGHVDVERVRDT